MSCLLSFAKKALCEYLLWIAGKESKNKKSDGKKKSKAALFDELLDEKVCSLFVSRDMHMPHVYLLLTSGEFEIMSNAQCAVNTQFFACGILAWKPTHGQGH